MRIGLFHIAASVGALFLLSCGSEKEENRGVAGTPAVIKVPLDLSDKGMPFTLFLNPQTEPMIYSEWNANFGRLEIQVPPDNEIYLLQDDYTCKQKREELSQSIFEINYIVNSDSLLIYESRIPAGNVSYWHFFRCFEINGLDYYAENNPLIECSKTDVKLMSEIFADIRSDKNIESLHMP